MHQEVQLEGEEELQWSSTAYLHNSAWLIQGLGWIVPSVQQGTGPSEKNRNAKTLKLKREHGDVMGNTWCLHMRKKQWGKEIKPCGHCTGKSTGTPECYSWASPAYLRHDLGLPFRKMLLWTMCSAVLLSCAQIVQRATFCHWIGEPPVCIVTARKSASEKAAKVTG